MKIVDLSKYDGMNMMEVYGERDPNFGLFIYQMFQKGRDYLITKEVTFPKFEELHSDLQYQYTKAPDMRATFKNITHAVFLHRPISSEEDMHGDPDTFNMNFHILDDESSTEIFTLKYTKAQGYTFVDKDI